MIKTIVKWILYIKAAGYVMEAAGFKQSGQSKEIDVLARTIYGEARGEGMQGMQAVANVVMNRAKNPGWWGNDVISVCKKPYQFSCWNLNDPNYYKINTVTKESDPVFEDALYIAQKAVSGQLTDLTDGATHYHAANIEIPNWAWEMSLKGIIGSHVFYA